MKRVITIALAATVLVGCTKVVEVQTTVPVTPSTTEPASSYDSESLGSGMTVREQFIEGVETLYGIPYGTSTVTMWEAGNAICDMAAQGYTLDEISTELIVASEFDGEVMDFMAAVAASAFTFICPEYGYLFDESSGF